MVCCQRSVVAFSWVWGKLVGEAIHFAGDRMPLRAGDLLMKKCGMLILLTVMTACVAGCGKSPKNLVQPRTAGDVVTNLLAHAQTNDVPYFVTLLDAASSNQAPQLVSMIQRSGMETNYLGRLRKDSATQARLDYHDEEHNCHFQVDLQQKGADWKVRRIYFCR
jgi:hypothetical protein